MAWLPIQYTVPQYWKQAADGTNEYSGAVLKSYQVGTTTNIPFATDNEGMTTANSIALNANGNPEVGGNVVIPHLDQDYKLAFYPDQASADSDSGAIWTIDDIDLVQTSDTATAADYNVWPLVDYGGAYFDGTNDYLTRGAGLTGASDGKAGTIVAFVTFDASATAIEYVVHSTGGAFILRRDSDGVFRIIAENASGSVILNMATQNAYNDTNTVYCVMASWDLATPGSNQLYVNDTSDVATTTFTNDTVDYTVADWAVGADVSGSNKITGNVLSVWFDQTDNLDFDMELNRRRFLDEQDNPVFLGVQGELPTGTQPILFLGNYDETEFETNRGSGGDFTENGTLAAATVDFDGQFSFGFSDAVAARRDIAIVTTQGDIILADSSGDESRLAIGSANRVLRSDGTTASWGQVVYANLNLSNDLVQGDIANSAIGQGELKTSRSSVSDSTTQNTSFTTERSLPGGQYGFYPELVVDFSGSSSGTGGTTGRYELRAVDHDDASGDVAATPFVVLIGATDDDTNISVQAHQRFVDASRPYDLGDGECGLFVELRIRDDGFIAGTYISPCPVWAYNGPTDIRPDFTDPKTGKKYKSVRRPSVTLADVDAGRANLQDYIAAQREAPVEVVEITNEYKNADMTLIPHSWVSPPQGTICLLDPVNTHDLLMLHEAGEDVGDLIHKGYIRVGDEVKRRGPPGVVPVTFKWKNS